MEIGTQQNPALSCEPAKIARTLADTLKTPDGNRGIWFHKGVFYLWEACRWREYRHEDLKHYCWRVLEDYHYQKTDGDGVAKTARLKPTVSTVMNVMEALEAQARLTKVDSPCWLQNRPGQAEVEPPFTISFDDQLVSVKDGVLRAYPRSDLWFEPVIVNTTWQPEAKCPIWTRCLGEWSGGDEMWQNLLQRWVGYCLMPTRRHAKLMLMMGRTRAGKGTITKVIEALLGLEGYAGTSLYSLAGRFGMEGITRKRVLCVNEVQTLDNPTGERVVQLMKSILGEDRFDVDVKYHAILRNVRVPAALMMISNKIPQLPNEGEGLSSKMLMLGFHKTFRDNPQTDLIYRLLEELPGIAVWAVEGARQIEEAKTEAERWPVPESSRDVAALYLYLNNPLDGFLKARFEEDETAFLASDTIWQEYVDWRDTAGVKRADITRNNLFVKLEQESTWLISRHRPHGMPRGMRGLKLRPIPDDEL